jgi:hypothetical protein
MQSGQRLLITLSALFLFPAGCFAKESNAFNDLTSALGSLNEDQCQKTLYSSNVDQWIRLFLDGKDKEAALKWNQVLASTAGATTLRPLIRGLHIRLSFMGDADADKFAARGGMKQADNCMLTATAAKLGANSCLLATMMIYVSDDLAQNSRYIEATDYAQKAYKIYVKAGQKAKAIRAMELQTKQLIKAKQYASAIEIGEDWLKQSHALNDTPQIASAERCLKAARQLNANDNNKPNVSKASESVHK